MLINTLATLSLIGIWPRFIEPAWLQITRHSFAIKDLPSAFHNFTILHLSDIHFSQKPSSALGRAARLVETLKPDCIILTGDFLCYSQLPNSKELAEFLSSFKAPFGSYAVLGNHDYSAYVSFGTEGKSIVLDKSLSLLSRFKKAPVPPDLPPHEELLFLLSQSPFTLLRNETIQLHKEGASLNITGLGDWFALDSKPDRAFQTWDPKSPGLVLCHNPMSAEDLLSYPGDLILAGHTHGSQINIPLFRDLLLQKKEFRRGVIPIGNKKLFISRGLGSHIHFRLFSRPEISLLTLHA